MLSENLWSVLKHTMLEEDVDDFNESEGDEDVKHYGVLGMKWGIRRYQPYPDGKKGTYLGKKPKYTKEENRTRKDLTRGVTAAQKNLTDKEKLASRAQDVLSRAKKENEAAHKMVVLPWNRDKKRELIAETEKYVQEAMKDLEVPRANVERAKSYAMKQISALEQFASDMNSKYGSENIKQLKYKQTTVSSEEGHKFVNNFVKTGVNMANFPVIGNWVAADYITAWESADRDALLKQRAENIRKNIY